MPYLQHRFNLIAIDVRARVTNNITLFYMDVITYTCPEIDAGLFHLV